MSNIATHNLSRYFYRKGRKTLAKIFSRISRILYSCEIPPSADISQSVVFAHKGLGVVIGHDTVIGAHTRISQNVTIGGRSGIRANPVIGKYVMIGAGACVLGNIKIGDNVKIGANAVVIKDVAEGSTVVGIPAHEVGGKLKE
jgi:serine O-acetyltransferase